MDQIQRRLDVERTADVKVVTQLEETCIKAGGTVVAPMIVQ